MADTLAAFEKAVLDFGKSYGLGTPESRAVITAVEHARAALNTETARSGELLSLAREWEGRGDDCGRLARAVVAALSTEARDDV